MKIAPVQSAYRQFFSTETAVLKVVSDVLTALDRGQITHTLGLRILLVCTYCLRVDKTFKYR